MAEIFTIQGISLNIYALDQNPPHLHVKYGNNEFVMTLADREVEGKGSFAAIKMVNDFIDSCKDDLLELWDKAQRGERIPRLNVKE